MKLDDIRIDSARIEGGEWIDNIPLLGDLRVKVRGINSRAFQRARNKRLAEIPRSHRINGHADEEMERAIGLAMADALLIEWGNLDAEYSRELAEKLLTDPDYATFRDGVAWAASQVQNLQIEDRKTDEKN